MKHRVHVSVYHGEGPAGAKALRGGPERAHGKATQWEGPLEAGQTGL